ncbi:AAA family ATPase [Pelagibius sp.]|uniref:AAA family ATPase n=1 Tax=Pelagibius sp. TaxID=1931238 RepID=UPI00261D99F9|nr:AAA family ATPase [Pelagibius sp.]
MGDRPSLPKVRAKVRAKLRASAAAFQIGDWSIDPASRRITQGEKTQRISPKSALVLTALAEAEGEVVSRGDLLDRVWPEVTVGEEVLTQAIAELRRAFRDSARAPRYIETVPKAGYRLLAEVRTPALSEGAPEDADPAAAATPSEEGHSEGNPAEQPAIFVLGREHKQVTVLDCALNDAAALAAEVDAETIAETIDFLHQIAQEVVTRYDGTIAQWQGDGLVALFGAPQALEDHPRCAIGAARELMRRFVGECLRLGDDRKVPQLSVGIHTGPAVVGFRGPGSREIFTAIGVTTETAKHHRLAAPAGVLLASADTCRIVGSELITSVFEPKSAPVGGNKAKVYQVHAFTNRRSGVPRRGQPFLSRFVGRDRELDMLLDRIDSLRTAGGQVITVTGDPGIGKSRLTAELEARLTDSGTRFLRAHCLPHGRSSPYLPLARLLQELCSLDHAPEEADPAEALADRLWKAGLDNDETAALFQQLLGLPFDSAVLEPLSADQKKQRIFDGLHRLVADAAKRAPLVILIEDLHWIDATSEAWLAQQAMRLTGIAALLLVTHRPGYRAPWQSQSSATQIALPALGAGDSGALIRSVPRRSALTQDAMDHVVRRAQGNPFFLEELAFTYPGDGRHVVAIPDTVQAVIAARVDRLPAREKRLLQIAAVVGARIPLGLLERIDGLDTAARRDSLMHLQQTELLYERHGAPDHVFAFKHALTQDVAYLGLVAKARRTIHQDIADVLARDFAKLVDQRPEILARHLTEAGRKREAIAHWRAAGRQAAARATGIEAVAHYETALSLIDSEPAEDALAEIKLAVLVDLGVILQALKGAGAAEAGEVYRQACALSRRIARSRNGFVALWGLWRYTVMNARFEASEALAEDLLALSKQEPDAELDLQAHHAIWTTARFTGSLTRAIEHAEAGLALDDPRFRTAPHYPFGGHDPICCARGTRAIALGLQGKPESANHEMEAAIALAENIGHRPTIAGVFLNATDLYLAGRDRAALGPAATRLRQLGEDLGFAMHANIGSFALAWCRFKEHRDPQALNDMRQVLDRAKRAGGTAREPYHYALFADCLAEAGQFNEARCVINEVFEEISEKRQNHWAKSEAHRMLGEIQLRARGDQHRVAEHHFKQARRVAGEQGALALELRATCSLARLWQRQGRSDEATTLLQAVCNRFTEGFESTDLVFARNVMAQKP